MELLFDSSGLSVCELGIRGCASFGLEELWGRFKKARDKRHEGESLDAGGDARSVARRRHDRKSTCPNAAR